MNDRQFAAIHDRYMNPPEENYDDRDNDQAEDIAHGQRLQEIWDKEAARAEYEYWLKAEQEQAIFWAAEAEARKEHAHS